jgi:2-polyprenyl-3-methyl-5-hydroxy-6-metoxy-1,4-benzoquinol methylase
MENPVCHICSGNKIVLFMKKNGSSFYRCLDCRLEFIFPQPGDEALKEIYSKNYYDSWGLHIDSQAAEKSKRLTFEYRLNLIKDLLKPGDKILDCGCATGFFLDLVKQKGYSPYGIEISDYAVQVAKEKFGDENIFRGNIEDARFSAGQANVFSAIFMTDYLEHVRSPRETLSAAFRLLRPGGALIITTPDTSSLSKATLGKSWIHYKTEHLFYFSQKNIRSLLEQTGFNNVKFQKAKKYFTPEYVFHQFNVYNHPVFTPFSGMMYKLTPTGLRKKVFSATIGEMVAVVRKPV